MNLNTFETRNREFKDKFLIKNKLYHLYKNDKNIIWIYLVTDITNGKIYIGKTKNLNRRINEYYNYTYRSIYYKNMKIANLIFERGSLDSFTFEPIYVCKTVEDAVEKELEYIDKFDSMNPEKGYNVFYQSKKDCLDVKHNNSRKQNASERMSRSKIICSINIDTREIYLSTGLCLFGKIINRTKDEVKSAARRASSLNGFVSIYLNEDDSFYQVNFCKSKLNNITSNNTKIESFIYFKNSYNIIYDFIVNKKTPINYRIKCIIQEDDISDDGYKYIDYKEFINSYNELIKNNKIKPIVKFL